MKALIIIGWFTIWTIVAIALFAGMESVYQKIFDTLPEERKIEILNQIQNEMEKTIPGSQNDYFRSYRVPDSLSVCSSNILKL